ncbi:NusB antitermination factor [Syntrophomonas zehnderi OL-4]|uniref:Transcription antitermination protein NusB n=1 Tax=Syntrophomonas zehnderi OL-4 TaxID=690567 RepID=A0A0E4C8K0_9FIRM|nr:transcription antitermination factor NusB [Syntrophomonas zehnderi]CFX49520.1 NusB antitermination factor [Syntrophomonas zehnderi OL-4]
MSRRKAREIAFKVIFQVDQVNAEPRTAFEYLLEESNLTEPDSEFAWTLIEGCLTHLEPIDQCIARHSTDWTVERMSSTDRNLMRLATYEILYMEEVKSAAIAMDEAIEISKKYGEHNSAAFVNAILDKINRNRS